ncbi:NAD(P)H-dependent oxidoreductase [Sphingomonas sp. ac-8]|uniref:NAD(P)H-dependent oxidoreductase n=1 Tax=Sphingomonas sp. ac-8 TaxID=3242977 RepID=UPI003A80B934
MTATDTAAGLRAGPGDLHHLVVLGHPAPDSFNHAIAAAYRDAVEGCGQRAVLRDLYALGFDPLLRAEERPGTPGFRLSPDVAAELELVARASAITLVYPIWFGLPPAIVTGYVDRVLGAGREPGIAAAPARDDVLAGKPLLLLTTSASTLPWLAERGQWHGLRAAFDLYLQAIFALSRCDHEHFDAVTTPLAPGYAAECLARVAERARTSCSALLQASHAQEARDAVARRQGERAP